MNKYSKIILATLFITAASFSMNSHAAAGSSSGGYDENKANFFIKLGP